MTKKELDMETYGLICQVLEKVGHDPLERDNKSIIEWIEDELGFKVTPNFLRQLEKD